MERFAADSIKAERDAHIKSALKANVPWPEIVETYGVTLEEVNILAGYMAPAQKKGSAVIWKPGDPDERRLDDGR
jgi:hypothetical protein